MARLRVVWEDGPVGRWFTRAVLAVVTLWVLLQMAELAAAVLYLVQKA